MAAPTEIALFAGAGGGVLASRILGHRIVCYVEREPFCVEVLKARIADGLIDDAPIWDDARTFDGWPWRGLVDIVSGGFPCQPFSAAGKRLGADDERNCWPDAIRIIRDVRPRVAFLENVAALVTDKYFGRILGDLHEGGYDARWDCIPASAVGATHQRDRLFVVGHAEGVVGGLPDECGEGLHDARGAGRGIPFWPPGRTDFDTWRSVLSVAPGLAPALEPHVRGVADGLAEGLDRHRSKRIRALGNGQVPLVAAVAFRRLGGDL